MAYGIRYQVQYDKQARAWNLVDVETDAIVGMFGGGAKGEQQAKRSADNHNTAWLQAELAKLDDSAA